MSIRLSVCTSRLQGGLPRETGEGGQEGGGQWGGGISIMEFLGKHRLYRAIKQKCLSVWLSVCPSCLEGEGGAAKGDGEGRQEGGGQWRGGISLMECQG